MAIITVHESLSFDTITKAHATLDDARAHMRKVLIDGGWPAEDARQAAEENRLSLVADDGDSETIVIREI